MADTVIITGEKTVTVVTVGVQGPAGISGSSVPATNTTLGGIIVGANLSITGNGVLSAIGGGGSVTTNLPWANITSKPTFANVATSGLYSDLTGTPNLSVDTTNATNITTGTLANARLGVSNSTLTYGASVAWSADYLKVATITLTGACSLTISGLSAGGTYNLIVRQDATGSRVVTWVTTVKWSAGAAPTLSTAANSTDIVSFIYDGTTLFGTALKGFA